MAFRLPRISIVTSDEQGAANMGELNMLSLGLGLHLAWMQAAFFDSTMPEEGPNGSFPFLFVVAMASFLATLLFAALTDQKLLPLYTARRAILPAAGSAALGSALLGWNAFGLAETPGIALPSSAMLGIGGALITLFWGTAFSRHDTLTISMNASFACATALVVYTCALQALPTPWAGMAETTLPVLGAPLLWKLTPTSYAVRHEIPIFDPLPVNKASFAARLAFPLVLFGFCLGVMAMAARNVLTTFGEASQAPVLLGGAAITVLVVAGTTAADENGQWDLPFRLAVPLAMAALLLLPSLPSVAQDPAAPASLILAAGILCLSALLWSFFGDMAQQFRLSPLFLYGAGQSMLTLGVLLGVLATMKPEVLGVGPQEGGMAAVSAMALVLAFASLPRVRDVKRAIQQQSERTHGWANRAQAAEMAGRRAEAPSAGPQGGGLSSCDPTSDRTASDAVAMQERIAGDGSWENAASKTPQDRETDSRRERSRFREQCEIIANRYLLSRRETEVLFLLAKGCNAARIQEKLCISKSTAKTHISHIYRKLDIHTQQELLRMVDEAHDGRDGAEHFAPKRDTMATGDRWQ